MFSRQFQFSINNGEKTLKTVRGTILTMMIGFILIGYAVFKANVLLSRSSVNVVSSIKDNFIKVDERFGAA